MKYKSINEQLDKLNTQIENYTFPLDFTTNWEGAGVIITNKKSTAQNKVEFNKQEYYYTFYSDCRYVITPYYQELSWLFKSLRDIFYDKNLLDHASKHEFFGRLANAANWYLKSFKKIEDQKVHELLSLVLSESKEILLEMENGDFMYLPITFDNILFDDIANKVRKTIKK